MREAFRYILFDLDGTLTDPKEGICKSVQYALHKMNIEEPDIDRLEPFIGPPLSDSFCNYYHMTEEEAQKAIEYYRERFSAIGLFENVVYDGIPEMLKDLREKGCRLAVASSKPEVFVRRILKHFGLENYFDVIVGSELDGRRTKKEEVVEEALVQLYELTEHREMLMSEEILERKLNTAMVGDRIFDMNGAKEYGLCGVAVTYGYAPVGELEKSDATVVVQTVKELHAYLSGEETGDPSHILQKKTVMDPVPGNSFFRAIYMIIPFVIYYLVYYIVREVGIYFSSKWTMYEWIIYGTTERSAWLASLIATIAILFGGVSVFVIYWNKEPIPYKKTKWWNYLLTGIAGALLALGLNLVISSLYKSLGGSVELYSRATFQSSLPLGIGVFLYILVSPIVEELLFRWLLYGRIQRVLGKGVAVVVTALFFGLYHGNLLQGIYAGLMGLGLALVLYWSDNFYMPVIFHVFANALVYLLSFAPDSIQKVIAYPGNGWIYVILGIGLLFVYRKRVKS